MTRPVAAGYTLIEALAVAGIIGVVSGVALVNYNTAKKQNILKQAVDGIVYTLNQAQQNALGGTDIRRCDNDPDRVCVDDSSCLSGGVCVGATGYGVHFTASSSTYDVFYDLTQMPTCQNHTKTCLVDPDCDEFAPADDVCVYPAGLGSYDPPTDALVPILPSYLTTHELPPDVTLDMRTYGGTGASEEQNATQCEVDPAELHITFQPPASNAVITDVISDVDENFNAHSCRDACIFVRSSNKAWVVTVRRASGLVEYKELADPSSTTCPPV